jgi:RNase P protein component
MDEDLPNWDFVVVAKPLAKAADNAVLRASLERHFSRLRGERN